MIPLWMSASLPSSPRCGCALTSVGPPWVAQRVWPMPVWPSSRPMSARSSSEDAELAGALAGLEPARVVDDRDAGGVVAAVLQPLQTRRGARRSRCPGRRIPRFHTWARFYRLPAAPAAQRLTRDTPPRCAPVRWRDVRPDAIRRRDPVPRDRPRRLGRPRPERAAPARRSPRSSSCAASATRSTCTEVADVYVPLSRLLNLYAAGARATGEATTAFLRPDRRRRRRS